MEQGAGRSFDRAGRAKRERGVSRETPRPDSGVKAEGDQMIDDEDQRQAGRADADDQSGHPGDV